MTTALQQVLALMILALFASAVHAQAVVIDEFNDTQSGPGLVDGSGILGGERYVAAVPPNALQIGGGIVSMSLPEGESVPSIVLFYEGNDDTVGIGFNLGGIDLTSGGSNDRFYVAVDSISGTVDSTIRIANSAAQYSTRDFSITAPGIYELTFDSFVAGPSATDPASVDQVLIRFTLTGGDAITVSQFIAGPDPLLFEDGFETE